jgi:predicted acetyltransferase
VYDLFDMLRSEVVTLESVEQRDAPRLANLLELYLHDLSEAFPIEPGPDGRFGYTHLPLYWSEPQRRFPLFIRSADRIVGFVLVKRGSPAVDDPEVLDVAEFFVLRRHRRSGIGRQAAFLVWDRLPGRWTVRVLASNRGAVTFWSEAVGAYAGNTVIELDVPAIPGRWRVFSFQSPRNVASTAPG